MHVQAPTEYLQDAPSVFLAGGTSGRAWQLQVAKLLADSGLAVLNPRRRPYPEAGSREEEEQVAWEHRYLRQAAAHLYWFPPESFCPITLYELGAATTSRIPLFVGVHPQYRLKRDVILRLQLARSDVEVVSDLDSLARQVIVWAKEVQ